jgi:hypothetical protein
MDRLGCGFADMALARDEARRVHLLALGSDGKLLDYLVSRGNHDPDYDSVSHKPVVLANGGVKLFQENDYSGNVSMEVFLLRRDGSLGRWYWRFGGQYPKEGIPPERRLERIDFPKEWFDRDALEP